MLPTVDVQRSFLAAWDELTGAEERAMGARGHAPEREWSRAEAADPAEFTAMVAAIRHDADPAAVLAPDLVHQTTLWFVDGDEWLGQLAIRHRLTPVLLELGGHIGYYVRPSVRRRGHATAMLAQALPIAAELGIDPVLITCDADNVASRKVIESCGGEFEDRATRNSATGCRPERRDRE